MSEERPEHVIELSKRYAVEWDHDRNTLPFERHWHDRFADLLPAHASILDLGCGSGRPVAWNLVERGHHVTGIDTSPAMIELSRQRMPAEDWIVQDMRAVALGRQFDGVLGWDGFFFLSPDDQRQMFSRVFAPHAAPSAYLMFNTGPQFGSAIGSYRGEPLYHASLDASEYRQLLASSGFEVIEHVVEDRAAGGRTVWLARKR